jgi:tRNA (mo5U34)-methyltransferase
MTAEELAGEVARIRWYHRMDLGHGVVTPGRNDPAYTLRRLHLPASFAGKTVLDVGAWDGFYSFEAERRGAARVLATDHFCWGHGGPGTRAGFDLARRALGSRVEAMEIDVLELAPERVGTFDVVLFLGVLYHMRHPLLALERVASVTRELLVVETAVDLLSVRRPAAAFYPGRELAGDPTNWWGPNPAAVIAMLRDVGFPRVEIVTPPASLSYRLARFPYHVATGHPAPGLVLRTARIALHARRA